jgi:hypothetical protein
MPGMQAGQNVPGGGGDRPILDPVEVKTSKNGNLPTSLALEY